MTLNVYLGDLRYHTAGILANDCMPLGVAYMKAVIDRDNPAAAARLFVYPDVLLEALKSAPPDVLMLSNYVWNEALSREFFRIAKMLNPNVLTVMGGRETVIRRGPGGSGADVARSLHLGRRVRWPSPRSAGGSESPRPAPDGMRWR